MVLKQSIYLEDVHIQHNDYLLCVDYNNGLEIWIWPWVKGQGQIYLKSVLWFLTQGCVYLAQWLLNVCKPQWKLQITGKTLESKVKVKYV